MFTGIVEELGAVRATSERGISIAARTVLEGTRLGDSIAVNGTCLTIVALDAEGFAVETVPETLRCTNLGVLQQGHPVNLERSLAVGARLGGHIVQGHVEGTGTIVSVMPEREALMVRVEAGPQLMRYIVCKGFIAVDGTSLTVVDRDARGFSFTVIPYTREHTVLGFKEPGDMVNLETDIMGRYAAQFLGLEEAPAPVPSGEVATAIAGAQGSEDNDAI